MFFFLTVLITLLSISFPPFLLLTNKLFFSKLYKDAFYQITNCNCLLCLVNNFFLIHVSFFFISCSPFSSPFNLSPTVVFTESIIFVFLHSFHPPLVPLPPLRSPTLTRCSSSPTSIPFPPRCGVCLRAAC